MTKIASSYRFPSPYLEGGQIRQPFQATCAKCGETIFFDIDPGGTPGHNGFCRNLYPSIPWPPQS